MRPAIDERQLLEPDLEDERQTRFAARRIARASLTAYALRPEALPPELGVLLGRSPGIASWACW